MFTVSRTSMWRRRWDVARDGTPVARFERETWRQQGRFTMDGRDHLLRMRSVGRRAELHAARVEGGEASVDGPVLATAERIGRKDWTVSGNGLLLRFRRPSVWRRDQDLLDDTGSVVGGIRRAGRWSIGAEADLPGVPDPVAVFTVLVVVMAWEAAAAASSGAGAGT